ncbi:protein unc-45 homolog B-like [Paramacrobiotus metropolitanus]|uniref:protein unc-45 homolog B-like n=1 Tax=Paramacrobiotus metropolitanus TaxID=2943436 RepID=UPI00244594C3|nr:protein unc-45 homolog B-like [Paramacrobiotus metropolitanus]
MANGEQPQDANTVKEAGNAAFKAGQFQEALRLYSSAFSLTSSDQPKERLAILKNEAACYLKLQDYDNCVKVTTQALDLSPNDPKAMFRRCQALEALNRIDEAYKDALLVAHAEPKDGNVQETVMRLHRTLQELSKKQASTEQRVTEMMKMFGPDVKDVEKRRQAASNLIVLARDKAGAEKLMERKIPEQFVKFLKDPSLDKEVRLSLVRALGELFKGDVTRCRELLRKRIGLPPLLNLYSVDNDEVVTAVSVAVENVIRTLSGWIDKEKPDRKMIQENQDDIDHTMESLVSLSDRAVLSAVGRDAVIDLILKNIQENLSPGLGWTYQFMERDGIQKFLNVAVYQPGGSDSDLLVTNETRVHIALALQKIYDDLDSDKKRNIFKEKCEQFVSLRLNDADPKAKIRAVLAVTALLQGPFDVGNFLLGTKGILELLLAMASSDDANQQLVAAEAMVHAASKKDKCAAILGDGLPLLKKLAQSPNDNVQVRALVGLCKVGSSGGIDASNRPLSKEMMEKLADACRKFLLNASKDFDLRRWAAEGLAYLTLDADVKESLIADRPALRSLIDLGRTGNQNVIYGVVSVFANLCNAYEKPEVVPEMKELAKFAKQHVPVEHQKDSPEFIAQRIAVLVDEGIGSSLVAVSKSESKNIRELISRVFNGIVENKDHRGMMVQQGAAKVLIKLALDGTPAGKEQASQALARIGISINPEIAFPGQRSAEVVRPLLNLLDVDKGALQNFEGLLALTNLAQLSESVRQRIVKDGGLAKVEHYLYEEHEMLKRAATECVCNLMLSPDLQDLYINVESDRIKLLVLYCGDEDPAVARAASGALAMLSQDPKACEKIIKPNSWLEIMKESSMSDDVELRVRILFILGNLIKLSDDAAKAIANSELLEILMATVQLKGVANEKSKSLALAALRAALKKQLIAPNPDLMIAEEEEEEE